MATLDSSPQLSALLSFLLPFCLPPPPPSYSFLFQVLGSFLAGGLLREMQLLTEVLVSPLSLALPALQPA